MRISDWSSDVCSSDLWFRYFRRGWVGQQRALSPSTLIGYWALVLGFIVLVLYLFSRVAALLLDRFRGPGFVILLVVMGVIVSQTFRKSREGKNLDLGLLPPKPWYVRSEEHTSELQSLMRISYAVLCLKQKKTQ